MDNLSESLELSVDRGLTEAVHITQAGVPSRYDGVLADVDNRSLENSVEQGVGIHKVDVSATVLGVTCCGGSVSSGHHEVGDDGNSVVCSHEESSLPSGNGGDTVDVDCRSDLSDVPLLRLEQGLDLLQVALVEDTVKTLDAAAAQGFATCHVSSFLA